MGLMVTFVSGPRRSGKSVFIQELIRSEYEKPPHYLRLAAKRGDKRPPQSTGKSPEPCGVASARWLSYECDEIFDVLPTALTEIHRADRYGSVLIEADADPHLRHAYPYDQRIFVLPAPISLREVFRTADEAAGALREVLDDTAAFATEIYGMFFDGQGMIDDDASEPRRAMTASSWRSFLHSPLGDELATRIQLQPSYHGLVESDVVLLNTANGGSLPVADQCMRQIEKLLTRVRGQGSNSPELFRCDPRDVDDPQRVKLFKTLDPMCRRAK